MSNEEGFLPYDPADLDHSMASKELLDLLDQVELDLPGWLPQEQPKIGGKVVDISEATSDFQRSPENPDGNYPLVIIQSPSGKLTAIHCFHTVLRKEIVRRTGKGQLKIGDLIAISYKGPGVASAGKNAAEMYRVAVHQQ